MANIVTRAGKGSPLTNAEVDANFSNLNTDLALASSSLLGTTTVYISQEVSYAITDFDSFSTYNVSATSGSATISGSTVTFTAPGIAGVITLTLTKNSVARNILLTVLATGIAAPEITAPAPGATNITYPPTITTGAFAAVGVSDTHLNTDYELWSGANRTGTLLASNYADSSSKTSWATPGGVTVSSTAYYPAVRHRGTALGASAWTVSSFTTVNAVVVAPSITSPANSATGITGPSITLTSSAFAWAGVSDTHLNSDWQLATDAGFTSIAQSSIASTSDKTSWATTIAVGTVYYARVLHRGNGNGASSYSSTVSFTTAATFSSVVTPTITSPANLATGVSGSTLTLTSSAFAFSGVADTHLNSDWYLATDAAFTTGLQTSLASTANKTSWSATVAVSTTYYAKVLHRGTTTGAGSSSATASFTTAATFNAFVAAPTATPAAFGTAFEGGFYAGTIWNELIQSASSTLIGTGSKTFTVADMTAVPLVYAGQMLEVRSRANPSNKMIGVVTGGNGALLTINVTSVGGSGTFTDWSVMARYRLIVAPKATGENTSIAYKNTADAAPLACQTLTEGRKATLAMVSAGASTVYPAAHWCNNLNIGGKTDWYLPARDELELAWRNLKPTADANYVAARAKSAFVYANLGSVDDGASDGQGVNNNSSPVDAAYTAGTPAQVAAGINFRTGESEAFIYGSSTFWSSSQVSATHAWAQRWSSSVPGYQLQNGKANAACVRAFRRSIL